MQSLRTNAGTPTNCAISLGSSMYSSVGFRIFSVFCETFTISLVLRSRVMGLVCCLLVDGGLETGDLSELNSAHDS